MRGGSRTVWICRSRRKGGQAISIYVGFTQIALGVWKHIRYSVRQREREQLTSTPPSLVISPVEACPLATPQVNSILGTW